MSSTTKMGLPAPYNLKAKRTQRYLTTPMKKLIVYLVAMICIGFIVYNIAPKKEVDKAYSVDTAKSEQAKEEAVDRKIIAAIKGQSAPVANKNKGNGKNNKNGMNKNNNVDTDVDTDADTDLGVNAIKDTDVATDKNKNKEKGTENYVEKDTDKVTEKKEAKVDKTKKSHNNALVIDLKAEAQDIGSVNDPVNDPANDPVNNPVATNAAKAAAALI